MMQVAQLYFHSPCFDGIVSGVLAWDLLETQQGWCIEEFHAVNYKSKSEWLSTKLSLNAVVVDFLYHPDARLWADHHSTTFLTEEARRDFENRRDHWLIYDKHSGSCALLLWKYFLASFGYRNQRYQNLVEWADRIDSARYTSVEQAIFGREPALRINRSLAGEDSPAYCTNLLKLLKSESVEYVASLPEVRERSGHAESLIREGLQRFVKASRLEPDGIVVYVVDSTDVIISRYAPYYVFPDASYSVGLVTSPDGASIRAMRNPWRDFPSLSLGEIFRKFGGGGHQRVGALIFPSERTAEAPVILDQILSEMRRGETKSHDSESQLL